MHLLCIIDTKGNEYWVLCLLYLYNVTTLVFRTPLMVACQVGAASLVSLLLDYRADTQAKDSKGWTADDSAVIAGHHKCSELISGATSV